MSSRSVTVQCPRWCATTDTPKGLAKVVTEKTHNRMPKAWAETYEQCPGDVSVQITADKGDFYMPATREFEVGGCDTCKTSEWNDDETELLAEDAGQIEDGGEFGGDGADD